MTERKPKNGRAYRLEHHWGAVDTGPNICLNEGCDRRTMQVHCRQCYTAALRELARAGVGYQRYVQRHDAYVKSLNQEAVRACGSGNHSVWE